jgi:hypothetical protein
MPTVSIASSRCSGRGPSALKSFGATLPTPGCESARRMAAMKPGVRKQSGCMNSTASPSTLRKPTFMARQKEWRSSSRRHGTPSSAATSGVLSSEALSSTTTSTSPCASSVGSEWRSSSPSFVEMIGTATLKRPARRRPR